MYESLSLTSRSTLHSDHLVAERVEMRREGRIMEQREKGARERRREKGRKRQ